MKKVYLFIIAAIIMAMPDMAKAQSDYRQALKELMENYPRYSAIPELLSSQFSSSLNTINQQILVDKTAAETVADKYLKEQMMNDIYDLLFVPSFSKNISVEEIKEANAMLNTPEGKAYMEKSQAMEQSLGMNIISDLMLQIITAGDEATKQTEFQLKPVQPYAGCTEEYKEEFNKYFETFNDDLFNAINTLIDSPMMQKELNNGEDSENSQKISNIISEYLRNNMKVMMLNACHESLTIDDLRIGAKIQGSPVFSKITKSGMELIERSSNHDYMQDVGMKWGERYVSWLQKQNIKMKDM